MIQTIILILLLLLGCAENTNICQSKQGETHLGRSNVMGDINNIIFHTN